MGSFNTTCFASNQTIASGDACWVIPIRQSAGSEPVEMQYRDKKYSEYAHASTTCYPTAFWEPVGEPIRAEYYDYGRVDIAETSENLVNMLSLFLYLRELGAVTEKGDNPYHDPAFDIQQFLADKAGSVLSMLEGQSSGANLEAVTTETKLVWDYIWEVAHEHRLFVGSSYAKPVRQFQFAVVHDSSYQKLIELYEGQEPWGEKPYERRAFVDYALERSVTTSEGRGLTDGYFISSTLRDAGYARSYSYQLSDSTMDTAVYSYVAGGLSADGLYEKVKPWIDFRYFLAGLEILNLKVSPLVYASQDYGNEVGEMYTKFVSEVSAEICAERRKDDELEESGEVVAD